MILKPDFSLPFSIFFSFKFFQVSRVIAGPDGFFLTGSRQPLRPYARQLSLSSVLYGLAWGGPYQSYDNPN